MKQISIPIIFCLLIQSCIRDNTKMNSSESSKTDTPKAVVAETRDLHLLDKSDMPQKIRDEQKIDPALLSTWKIFTKAAAGKDLAKLKELSFDTVKACGKTFSIDKFLRKCSPGIFDAALLKRFSEISYSTYTVSQGMHQFQVLKELTLEGGWTIIFDFEKTADGYKFKVCDSYGGPVCCR